MTLAVATGPADLRDQRWLDERIETARNGIEAVIDIALNWTEGRNVSRLHPGVAAADYVKDRLGLLSRDAVVPLLMRTNWSHVQIASITGASRQAVDYHAKQHANPLQVEPRLGADNRLRRPPAPRLAPIPEPPVMDVQPAPEEDTPSDTAIWDQLVAVMEAIDGLAESDATYVALTVPDRRRGATAKRLRKLGTYLGRIAWTLEGKDGQA